MSAKDARQQARTLGRQACERGHPCIPSQDRALAALLAGTTHTEALALIRSWSRGWQNAFHRAQTPEGLQP